MRDNNRGNRSRQGGNSGNRNSRTVAHPTKKNFRDSRRDDRDRPQNNRRPSNGGQRDRNGRDKNNNQSRNQRGGRRPPVEKKVLKQEDLDNDLEDYFKKDEDC